MTAMMRKYIMFLEDYYDFKRYTKRWNVIFCLSHDENTEDLLWKCFIFVLSEGYESSVYETKHHLS